MQGDVEEYELLPVSPLNKIQKQISKLQEIGNVGAISEAINRLIESNVTLQLKISKLLTSVDKVTKSMNELIDLFKSAGEEEAPPAGDMKGLAERVHELAEQNKELTKKVEAMGGGKIEAPKTEGKAEELPAEPSAFEYKRKLL